MSKMNLQPSFNATCQTSTTTTFLHGDSSVAMAPGNGNGEESGARFSRSSHAGQAFTDTLHELANAMTAVLVNAQVLEWKLPPYSRLKRPVREVERHAQRGGELLKRLLHQFEAPEEESLEIRQQVPALHEPMLDKTAAVTDPGPDTTAEELAKLPLLASLRPAPGSGFSSQNGLTSLCDPCTSAFFPKEES
jgi:hypothetical protein